LLALTAATGTAVERSASKHKKETYTAVLTDVKDMHILHSAALHMTASTSAKW